MALFLKVKNIVALSLQNKLAVDMKKIISLLLFSIGLQSFSQISEGGIPTSFSFDKKNITLPNNYKSMALQSPDLSLIVIEDEKNEKAGKPYRAAVNLPTNLSINNGTWTELPDGSRLWRLGISAAGAKALGIYFSEKLMIPEGGKLHVYNASKSQFIGAYTYKTDGFTAMEMVQGDFITLEYYAPSSVQTLPNIQINKVAYFYRGLGERLEMLEKRRIDISDRADACQVDVACPEINGWEAQRDAVVKYTFMLGNGTFLCSGALMNNTLEDCTPYILTANHCGEPTNSAAIQNHVWYFNYQRPNCSIGNTNPYNGAQSQTMSGGFFRASSQLGAHLPSNNNQVAGADFALLELNDSIPSAYSAFYAGWNRSTATSSSGVAIHHPSGHEKKISTYNSNLTTADFNGGWTGAHWQVNWIATASGHGVSEGGSSGSPIFNSNGKAIGVLSGGSSSCFSTSSPDLYGKLNRAWNQDGITASSQLRPWLDPINSGVTELDGSYNPCPAPIIEYCDAGSARCDEYITNVSLGGVSNTTLCTNYNLYWENNPVELARGLSYFLQISTGILGSNNFFYMGDQIGAWIDWNADGDFTDANEFVYSHVVDTNSTLPLQTLITVPQNAAEGEFRMRVRIMFEFSVEGPLTPCGISNDGEVEDYILRVDGALAMINKASMHTVSIYPNPSKGRLTVDLGNSAETNGVITVKDLSGRTIFEKPFNEALFDLDLTGYAKGLYLINMQVGNQTIVRKVIVD